MRFMYNSYDKLFPREEGPAEIIETAVEGFTPTSDLVQDKTPEVTPAVKIETPVQPIKVPQPEPIRDIPEEGKADGSINAE